MIASFDAPNKTNNGARAGIGGRLSVPRDPGPARRQTLSTPVKAPTKTVSVERRAPARTSRRGAREKTRLAFPGRPLFGGELDRLLRRCRPRASQQV